tara:strand:- start:171 stop:335 length:165 start_codon:yes stop_codon:yes gene_type:complete
MNTILINNFEIKYPAVGCDMQHIIKILGKEKTIIFAKRMQDVAPDLWQITALPK